MTRRWPGAQVMLQRHNMLQRQVLLLRAASEPVTDEDRARLEARAPMHLGTCRVACSRFSKACFTAGCRGGIRTFI